MEKESIALSGMAELEPARKSSAAQQGKAVALLTSIALEGVVSLVRKVYACNMIRNMVLVITATSYLDNLRQPRAIFNHDFTF